MEALHALTQERVLLHKIADQLKSTPLNASDRLEVLLAEVKEMQKELSLVQAQQLSLLIPALMKHVKVLASCSIVTAEVADVPTLDALRDLAIKVRDQIGDLSGVVALGAVVDGKPAVIVTANTKAQATGVKAGDLVRLASQILGGGGGGKADIAQGGGTDSSKMNEALEAITESLR
jgi:alanyl-tRNA synthetase